MYGRDPIWVPKCQKRTLCGKVYRRTQIWTDRAWLYSAQCQYAFTLGCELGVDVEELRELDDPESIAARFFSTAEVSELLSLKPQDRGLAFFCCWTRKEAYVKAIGDGLAIPLNRFQVTLLPRAPTRFVQIARDMGTASDWTLHHLELAPGYVGALAYRDNQRPITMQV